MKAERTMADRFRQTLRRTYKQVREQLSYDYQIQASLQVFDHIRSLKAYRQAKQIALYQETKGELSLAPLWRAAPLQGKFCFFPALNEDKTLSFLPATPATPFKLNRFGIAEPDVNLNKAIPPTQLDLIFMPLVAFDGYGTRLGMGAGYYDRTLAGLKPPMLVGIAYEFQHHPFIPPQSWDIPLQAIITPKTIYWRR